MPMYQLLPDTATLDLVCTYDLASRIIATELLSYPSTMTGFQVQSLCPCTTDVEMKTKPIYTRVTRAGETVSVDLVAVLIALPVHYG